MKKKNYNLMTLASLYLNYIFQKTTLIVLGASLFIMLMILVFMTSTNIDGAEYLLGYKDIHNAYFTQSLFVIGVFNGIITTTVVITIIINSISFDSMFVSYIPRYIICIAKMLAILITMSAIILFEVGAVYLIPLLKYGLYKTSWSCLILIPDLFISVLFELLAEVLLTTIIPSIFIPMTVLFISIVLKALTQSLDKAREIISVFIPILQVEDCIPKTDGMITGIIWIILLTFLYFSVYNIRDLKQM